MIFLVPEDLLEKARDLTPEKVYAVKHLIQPSVITSGDLKMATSTLDKLRETLRDTFIGLFEDPHPALGYNNGYATKTTTITSKGSPVGMVKDSPKNFIRYVRPTNIRGEILSFGGLTVYVDLDPENDFFRFSMSICGEKDLFNKKIAATICKNRFDDGYYFKVINYDQEVSVLANIYGAFRKYLHPEEIDDTLPHPTLESLPNKVKVRSLKKAVLLIEDYYSPVDWGSLHEIVKGIKP